MSVISTGLSFADDAGRLVKLSAGFDELLAISDDAERLSDTLSSSRALSEADQAGLTSIFARLHDVIMKGEWFAPNAAAFADARGVAEGASRILKPFIARSGGSNGLGDAARAWEALTNVRLHLTNGIFRHAYPQDAAALEALEVAYPAVFNSRASAQGLVAVDQVLGEMRRMKFDTIARVRDAVARTTAEIA